MPDFKHVGTVEILRARTYRIDPMNKDIIGTQAVVMPGSYPLMSDGYSCVWLDVRQPRRQFNPARRWTVCHG